MAASASLVEQIFCKGLAPPSLGMIQSCWQTDGRCHPCLHPNRSNARARNPEALPITNLSLRKSSIQSDSQRRRAKRTWRCKGWENEVLGETSEVYDSPEVDFEEDSSPSTSDSTSDDFPAPTKSLNQRLALASVAVAVGMFVATRGAGAGPDLNQLAANAMQYDEALANGRPTLVEFYADWCVVCREMAKEIYRAEQGYKDKVNFVLLNIDNQRWAEEVEEYGVGGIPHFVFLDSDGVEEGSAVGKLPRSILEDNLAAMARGDKLLPHSGVVGQISSPEQRPATLTAPAVVDPRTHG